MRLRWTVLLLGAVPALAAAPAFQPYNGPVLRAGDFVAAEGVNTHIPYTDGGYANIDEIIREVTFIGIGRIRDSINTPGIGGSAPREAYWRVATAGIRFDFIIGGGSFGRSAGSWTVPSLDERLDNIRWLQRIEPGSVIAVEGPNEINNEPVVYEGAGGNGGADRLNATLVLQRDLYQAVKRDSRLGSVPVYYFTGYGAGGIPEGPEPGPGLADFNNQHPYPHNGEPPAAWVSRARALTNGARGPAVYTEAGYTTNPDNGQGVPPDIQAAYTIDLLLDAAREGIAATYLYELMDAYPPGSHQGNAGYGLFDWQHRPKPVALALRAMNTLLGGTDTAPLKPAALSTRASSSGAHVLVMQATGGRTIVAVWDEPKLFEHHTRKEAARVDVDLSWQTPADVALHDPLQGEQALGQATAATAFHVELTGHPVFVVLSAQKTAR